jgi:hypothetical protein
VRRGVGRSLSIAAVPPERMSNASFQVSGAEVASPASTQ